MLATLHIENIAVIKCVDIDLTDGFTVLTGETGAGKSILIDSVNLLLGGKFTKELIRAGVLPADYDFEAHKKLVPMQAGDVPITYADVSALERDFGFKPSTTLREGLRRFAEWYKEFYKV